MFNAYVWNISMCLSWSVNGLQWNYIQKAIVTVGILDVKIMKRMKTIWIRNRITVVLRLLLRKKDFLFEDFSY